MMQLDKPIIALDIAEREAAKQLLADLAPHGETLNIKIGMEMFYHYGAQWVEEVQALGHAIFLDVKCHDIANTVERAMHQLADLGVEMITIHASGGSEMMRAAMRGVQSSERYQQTGERPIILAVTQLTSLDPEVAVEEQQLAVSLADNVLHLAGLTAASGVDGVICSPLEVEAIKTRYPGLLAVTPGIRPADYGTQDDQQRIMTPARAAVAGSDYIVIGRPITQAEDPYQAYQSLTQDWQQGLNERNTHHD